MLDRAKVAGILKNIQNIKGEEISIPKCDDIKGIFDSLTNESNTDPDDPLEHETPDDIGPLNDQTISGTGYGPPLAAHNGSGGGFNDSYYAQVAQTVQDVKSKKIEK